jgi:hypothetical protein
LLPLFLPVIESTELGRSLPSRVASATASRIALRISIWFTPTGVCTTNVGMPVSWQMGPSSSAAMSMFDRMMFERLRGLRRNPSQSPDLRLFSAVKPNRGPTPAV